MGTPDTRKRLLRVLAGEVLAPPPVWLMRQAGRYLPEYREIRDRMPSFLDLCYTPELALRVTLQPLERFALDAAILFSDILVVPHGLGVEVGFVEGEGPRVATVRDERALRALRPPEALLERLAPVYQTVRLLASALPAGVALIGFSGAPWTLASYLLEGGASKEFLEARRAAREAEGFFSALVDRLTQAVCVHLEAQVEAGADVLMLFDSWAGVLPESERRRWVEEPARTIATALGRRFPHVPLICFPRGIGAGLLAFAERVPCRALSLDTSVPLAWAREALARERGKVLQGNLDPVALVAGGAALERETRAILAAFRDIPHIFNLGHGVLPETSPAQVARLLEILQNCGGGAM
ncbi:Uroporphyrinogen decarboxylase [bacterium HR40]|nr:Uroporphyrinogen decarboxylase [bacterium HR40]